MRVHDHARCQFCGTVIWASNENQCSHPRSAEQIADAIDLPRVDPLAIHHCSKRCHDLAASLPRTFEQPVTKLAQCELGPDGRALTCGETGEFGECEHVQGVNYARDWMQRNIMEQGGSRITLENEEGIRILAGTVIDQHEEIERLRRMAKSCPCHHTTPCHDRCTCVNPLSSSGCARCCAYGSPEQRRAAAERFVRREHPERAAAQAYTDLAEDLLLKTLRARWDSGDPATRAMLRERP